MTIIITKTKLALAVLAVALLAPVAALASNVFADVDDGAFYAAPVEWAFNNNITTGKTATSFAPLDNVTRGESVTFLKRYNDNVVEPADAALQTDIDAAEAAIARLGTMYWAVINADGSIISRSSGVNSDGAETRRIATGSYEIDFADVADVGKCHTIVSRSDSSTNAMTMGQILAEGRLGDSSSIFVGTADAAGTPEDSRFTLQLWCSPAASGIIVFPLNDTGETSQPGVDLTS